jgi:hypothetical protein
VTLPQLLASVAAAAALAAALTGPAVQVLARFRDAKKPHPVVRRFDATAAKYREVLKWSD